MTSRGSLSSLAAPLPAADCALPFSSSQTGQGAPHIFRSLSGPDALAFTSEGQLARAGSVIRCSLRAFLFLKSRREGGGLPGPFKALLCVSNLGRVLLGRAPFFEGEFVQEKSGRFTLLINREAGFAVISGEYHSAQCDKAELRRWIAFYRRAAARKYGDFYVGTLRAYQRALELLTSEEVAV